MSDAVVIPFPMSRVAAGPAAAVDDRLAAALKNLQGALDEQAQAVKAWRFAMAELGVGVASLGQAMAIYDGSLATLDGKLGDLRSSAQALEAMADTALGGRA